MPWPLIDAALASPARWAVIPVADWLGLGSEARFNTPGTVNDQNWRWVVPPGALDESLALCIRARLERYGRLVDKEQP
jgi:4-alpha-glucanotransferase